MLSGNTTSAHTLTFSGAAAATGTTGTLTVNQTGLADASGNALGTNEAFAQRVADAQAPRILSANITAGNTVTVAYSEPVTAAAGASAYAGLELSTGGPARNVTALSGNTTAMHVITFDGAAAAANATGTLTVNQTGLADNSGNALGTNEAFEQPVADGQAPVIRSAAITAGNTVVVAYTEPVTAAAGASEYPSLALTPGGARNVDALLGNTTDTHTLTFDGPAAAANAIGTLTVNQTGLADASGNALGTNEAFAQRVADAQAPEIVSAAITAGRTITVVYNEPVTAVHREVQYTRVDLFPGGARGVNTHSGTTTNTHVIMFGGNSPAAAANATGMLTVNQAALVDASGNALGQSTAFVQPVSDGQAPRILSAAITAGNTVTVVYTEPVTAAAGASEYASLALSTGGATRTVDALSGDATDTHVLTFSGAAAAANATGTLTLDETGLADDSDNALGTDGASAQPVADGQAPRILSANITAANTVTVVYTEPVTAAAGASGVRRAPGAVHGRRHPHRRRPVRRRDRHARTHVQRRRGRGERHRNADAGRDRAGRRLRQRPWNRRGVRAAGRRRPGAPGFFPPT